MICMRCEKYVKKLELRVSFRPRLALDATVFPWRFGQEGSVHASTSAEVLEGLVGKHAAVAPILEFRVVNKYKTT